MKFRNLVAIAAIISAAACSKVPETISISSPDGVTKVTVSTTGQVTWSVEHDGYMLLEPSAIRLNVRDKGALGSDAVPVKVTTSGVSGTIQSPFYRQGSFEEKYNEAFISFKGGYGIRFRAYDEGVAYRIETRLKGNVIIDGETAEFKFPGDGPAYVAYSKVKDLYSSSFQNIYHVEPVSSFGTVSGESVYGISSLALTPLAVEVGDLKATVMESDVEDYPAMFLKGIERGYTSHFAPVPDSTYLHKTRHQRKVATRKDYIAATTGTRTYPWRIVSIADSDTQMPVSNLVYALASPSRVSDISFVKPGLAAWEWWNDWGLEGVGFEPGINTQTYKFYIDFAARFGIPYVVVDEGWSGVGDLDTIVEGLDLEEVISYGKEKGVGVFLWAVAYVLDEHPAAASKYAAMGVKGFKVDFVNRDDQEAVNMLYRLARLTADNGLMMDIHGTYHPTGMNRTYPNVVNFESVYGLEELKWANPDMPGYDVSFPYLRMAAGPADYTPGGFRNRFKDEFDINYSRPRTQGTKAHQIAEYVVFDSPLTMLCDSPTEYLADTCATRFMTSIPTVFDKTVVPAGQVGKYIVTARQKDGIWYVGALTDWNARKVRIDASFLEPGCIYSVQALTDVPEGAATDRVIDTYEITAPCTLEFDMASGGGAALIMTKK